MFKKDPIVKPFSNVKNSERRKLIKCIIDDYGLSEELLDADFTSKYLFPKVVQHAVFLSGTSNVRGNIYLDGETEKPIWFDTRDSKMLIPTVYTLWKSPYLLPIVYTHMGVVDRLVNGSNLMVRGCMTPFDERLRKGTLVAVSTIESPNIMVAVGYCQMDLCKISEITQDIGGVAVMILHCYKDRLYQLDKRIQPDPLPLSKDIELPTNLGLLEQRLREEKSDVADEIADLRVSTDDLNLDVQSADLNEPNPVSEEVEEQLITNDNDDDDADADADADADDDNNNDYSVSVQDVDDFFVRSVLYSITQDKLDLPMSSSIFMSAHVLKNLPPVNSNQANVKKTSWKKTSKFLKAIEKLQLVKLKGKGDDVTIISVADKSNERVASFEPYRIRKQRNTQTAKDDEKSGRPVSVTQFYKPKSPARQFFNKLDKEYDRYYREHELKVLVSEYIRKFGLALQRDPKLIRLDDTLKLMGVKGIREVSSPTERSKIFATIMGHGANFQRYYTIARAKEEGESEEKLRKGSPPNICVLIEQVRGRKKVMTRITGLEKYYIEPEELASVLKVRCSGSATINEIQSSGLAEVSVQGSHERVVQEILVKQYGLKSSWIDVTDKMKGQRRGRR
ncbi:DEKNAAC100124 [Brettanomyces naardenensis]|uniref:DEKNAAC100124 n=1 Tax=Brettanomyces naardenensis TaxID=13370 RepID=A0A448YFL7_BRENA|nr:DEKNAAC100124 [Brettanomyces naardenensis]